MARGHLTALGYGDLVRFHVAEAVETLERTAGPFDLIFNDIDKDAYPRSLPIIEQKLRPGGVLVVDNMLWDGRIFNRRDRSANTDGVRTFTQAISTSPDWIVSLVPIRDGIIVALKK
jgi:predicted O-methyltransferase YrrM